MKLTIAAKTMLGYLVVLSLLAVVSVTGLWGLGSVTASYEDMVSGVDAMEVLAHRLNASELAKSRAVLGWMLTQNPKFQTALDEAIRESHDVIAAMKELARVAEVQDILEDVEASNHAFDEVLQPVFAQTSFTPKEIEDLAEIRLAAARDRVYDSLQQLLTLLDGMAADTHDGVRSRAAAVRAATLAASALAVALGFGIGFVFSRSLSRPIVALAEVVRQVAAGDLRVKELRIASRDEVGDLAAAVNQMVRNLREVLERVSQSAAAVMSASRQLSEVSEGAARAAEGTSQAVFQVASGSAAQSNDAADAHAMVRQLQDAIDQIAAGAARSSAEVQESAVRLQQMLRELEAMAGATLDSAAGARQAAQHANAGADVVARTLQEMEQLGQVVMASAGRIRELDRLSGRIGAITEVISSIADQTNLLALNAAIEAARAGEHGRGFAVVAEEVRKLAERSAASTREIEELIRSIQSGTADAVKTMEEGTERISNTNQLAAEAAAALNGILSVAQQAAAELENLARRAEATQSDAASVARTFNDVAALTEENSAATEEMAAGAAEMTHVIDRVARVSQENAAATEEVSASVEELTASAEEVAAAARSLAGTAHELQAQLKRFAI
ncbi:methyl-accepting chemotaxis protein [Symbiobacterium terraclitae]|uniref:methyl-accepting chemotaxis protein n=1 Tax=Symbiobacterium terraclitae TaxID=557451 RepID=UPI0035B511BE